MIFLQMPLTDPGYLSNHSFTGAIVPEYITSIKTLKVSGLTSVSSTIPSSASLKMEELKAPRKNPE
jgi:predicted alpha/beta hydrolase family esterase